MPQRRKPEKSNVEIDTQVSSDAVVNNVSLASVDYKGAPGAESRVALGSPTKTTLNYTGFGFRALGLDDEDGTESPDVDVQATYGYSFTDSSIQSGTFSADTGLWGGYSRRPLMLISPTQTTTVTMNIFASLSSEGAMATPSYPIQASSSMVVTTSTSMLFDGLMRYAPSPGPNYVLSNGGAAAASEVETQGYMFNFGIDFLPVYGPSFSFSSSIQTPNGGLPNASFVAVAYGSMDIGFGYFDETGEIYVD